LKVEPRPPARWFRRVCPIAAPPALLRDRRALAYHEAGHAVLCCMAGVPISEASINSEGNDGVVELLIEEPAEDMPDIPAHMLEKAAVQLAAMYMGGVMSEMILNEKDVEPGHYLLLGTRDWQNAKKLLFEVFGTTVPLFYCQRLARAVLTENWAWVQVVAAEIETSGVISGEVVKQLRVSPVFEQAGDVMGADL